MRATARSVLIGLGLAGCMLVGPAAFAATVSGPVGSTALSQGDSGFAVRVLQGDLAQFGDYAGAVTGSFGASTAAALGKFQSAHGLTDSGVMDAATFQAIKAALNLGGAATGATSASAGSTATTASHGRMYRGHRTAGAGGRTSGSAGNGATHRANGATSTAGTTTSTTGAGNGGSGSSTGATASFVQGTANPTISGGLKVGGKIDGLTIVRVIHLTATAYGATAQDNYPYGPTDAFGKPLKPGDVAVDPSVIALNTKMYVTGYSTAYLPKGGELAVARDTGGAIKGNRIDMYINSTNESLINSFGIQQVTAYILR